jgi:transcriptional regulator with GAF, ATPase, and Fis domain
LVIQRGVPEAQRPPMFTNLSPAFRRALEKIPYLGESNATVLITGETGTGQERFAGGIHYHRPRRAHRSFP